MRDLDNFRKRIQSIYREADPFPDHHRPTQRDLAAAIGLARVELNRRLNGTARVSLSAENVRAIVRVLTEWGGLQTQAQAHELLELGGSPPLNDAAWQVPPLDRLSPTSGATTPQYAANQGNLPAPLTSFIGREQELAEVEELLRDTRLLTLTGVGGIGKTRLALELAQRVQGRYPNGVWLVQLAQIADSDLVARAIASALGCREEPGRSLSDTLIDYLRPRHTLLILDNCEHLIAAAARITQTLLRGCPHLQILATSREAMAIIGETNWQVTTLALPGDGVVVEALMNYSAVELFVVRARQAVPHFRLGATTAPAVVQICHQMDGIPLAIELAASKVRTLTVGQIARRLDDRLGPPGAGNRSAATRQQTLRASIEWSYELLSPIEQTLLRRLAAFAGGWTLEAAEVVCADDDLPAAGVLTVLSGLVQKSLVITESEAEEMRYQMLETIRQFAVQRLAESGEESKVRQRHAQLFLALAEQAVPSLASTDIKRWANRLPQEEDNLRAALTWLLDSGDSQTALRMAGILGHYWQLRMRTQEGRQWLERTLAAAGENAAPLDRARALNYLSSAVRSQGDAATALEYKLQALHFVQLSGEPLMTAIIVSNLGTLYHEGGDYQTALHYYRQGLELMQAQNNRWRSVTIMMNIGELLQQQGHFAKAKQVLEQALTPEVYGPAYYLALIMMNEGKLDEALQLIDTDMTYALINQDNVWMARYYAAKGVIAAMQASHTEATRLIEKALAQQAISGAKDIRPLVLSQGAIVERWAGHYDIALQHLLEALAIEQRQGTRPYYIGLCLEGLANIAAAVDDGLTAAQLLGAAEVVGESFAAVRPFSFSADYQRTMEAIHSQLDDQQIRTAWQAGRQMSTEEATLFVSRILQTATRAA